MAKQAPYPVRALCRVLKGGAAKNLDWLCSDRQVPAVFHGTAVAQRDLDA